MTRVSRSILSVLSEQLLRIVTALFMIQTSCAYRLRLCFDCATTKVLMAKESALKRLRIRKADDSYLSVGVFFLLPL